MKRRLVLASTSPYRAALLRRLRLPFDVIAPEVDEAAQPGEAPPARAARLARAKAATVANRCPGAIVIGSDQVATVTGRILDKPGTVGAARAQLAAASGQRVEFLTGLCVSDAASGRWLEAVVAYAVDFRALDAASIARYVELDQPLDCAGSIRAEGLGVTLLERMHGEDPTALIGLPLIELARMLRVVGLDPLQASAQAHGRADGLDQG